MSSGKPRANRMEVLRADYYKLMERMRIQEQTINEQRMELIYLKRVREVPT